MESVASDDKSRVVILVAVSSRVGSMPSGGLQLGEEEQGGVVVGGHVAVWVQQPKRKENMFLRTLRNLRIRNLCKTNQIQVRI